MIQPVWVHMTMDPENLRMVAEKLWLLVGLLVLLSVLLVTLDY